MKNLKIFLLVYAITFLGLIGLNAQTDIVNNGYIHITVDGDTLAKKFTLKSKADLYGDYIYSQDPTKLVQVHSPIGRFTGKPTVINTVSDSLINSLIERLEVAERAIEFQGQAISDFYTVDIPNMQGAIHKNDSLNAKKIQVLQNRIDTLQTFIKDSISFVHEHNEIITETILGSLDEKWDAWVYNEDGSYYFDDSMQYAYLIFNLNDPLKVGETYDIRFDIETDEQALLNIWLYPDAGVSYNGSITSNTIYESGSFVKTYTIDDHDRIKIGFRAGNFSGGGEFIIKNIKIEKL